MDNLTPATLRKRISEGLVIPTAGLCPGYIQANLVVLRGRYADEFREFAVLNPKPCPLLEILDKDVPVSEVMALGADVSSDIPLYRIYVDGELKYEYADVGVFWRSDMVAFLIGCSLSFESALVEAGINLKHFDENKRVPMYDTNIKCRETAIFKGNYVVSMRPIKKNMVDLAVSITEKMPYAHGAPVMIGNPRSIGISDISRPDYGDPLSVCDDEVPVFWACGVTPQAVARRARPDIMISHSPGYMFVTDVACGEMQY